MSYPSLNLQRNFIFLLFFFWTNALIGQKVDVISLKKQLIKTPKDTIKSQLYFELGKAYEYIYADSCYYFYEKSLGFAIRSQNQRAVAQSMQRIGYTYIYYIKNETKAIEWLNKAIVIAKNINDNKILAESYQLMGVIAFHQNIGNVYEIYLTALSYAKKTNDWKVLNDCYEMIAQYLTNMKKYKEAERYSQASLDICKKNDIDSWFTSGLAYYDLLVLQKKNVEAQQFAKKLNNHKDQLKMTKGYFVFMNDVAKLETILEEFDNAENRLLKVLKFETDKPKIDTFHLYFIYQSLENLYLKKQDFQKAHLASNHLSDIKLWLAQKRQTQDSKLQMTQLKANFDLQKKEVEIELLESQKKQQLIWLIIAGVASMVLVGFLVILQRNKKQIEFQRTELSQLNSTKDKLFAILSHDLRSPVASLKNYLMLTNWGVLNQKEFAESAKSLNKQLIDVNTTLENVLDWSISQIGGMQPIFKKVDLHQPIHDNIQFLKFVADQKQITIENEVLPNTFAMVDKNHLMIICRNLLQNAIKFTNEGGKIRFEYAQDDFYTTIILSDNGVGMTSDQQKDIFKLSPQTSSIGTAQEKGTGLGLFLVKELVEINSGKIKVNSEKDKGTIFEISFMRT